MSTLRDSVRFVKYDWDEYDLYVGLFDLPDRLPLSFVPDSMWNEIECFQIDLSDPEEGIVFRISESDLHKIEKWYCVPDLGENYDIPPVYDSRQKRTK